MGASIALRSQLSQVKGELQQTEVQQPKSQLSALENKLPQLETQATNLETEIAPIAERIKPLEELEQQQVTAFQNAVAQTQENAGNLAQTTEEHVQALRRLISFGVLASESDVDFFFLEIEPKILDFRDRAKAFPEIIGCLFIYFYDETPS